ncbi:MAG: cell division protein ZapA [Oceanococcus sp.]
MKSQDSVPLTVKILGRDYQVACPRDERDDLLASARYLDDRMLAIRKRAAGLGIERIAVMAALNMAREMLQMERDNPGKKSSAVSAMNDLDLDLDSLDADDEDARAQQMALRIDAELSDS